MGIFPAMDDDDDDDDDILSLLLSSTTLSSSPPHSECRNLFTPKIRFLRLGSSNKFPFFPLVQ